MKKRNSPEGTGFSPDRINYAYDPKDPAIPAWVPAVVKEAAWEWFVENQTIDTGMHENDENRYWRFLISPKMHKVWTSIGRAGGVEKNFRELTTLSLDLPAEWAKLRRKTRSPQKKLPRINEAHDQLIQLATTILYPDTDAIFGSEEEKCQLVWQLQRYIDRARDFLHEQEGRGKSQTCGHRLASFMADRLLKYSLEALGTPLNASVQTIVEVLTNEPVTLRQIKRVRKPTGSDN